MSKRIVLMVNSECNNNCKHCYISYTGYREPKETVRLVGELITQDYQVIIAGSETLLNLNYLEAYERARQRYILTNGILLFESPEVFDKLREYGIEEIRTSLHFDIQEDLGSVSETIIAKVIRESRNRGFRVSVSTVINQKNYLNLLHMCDRAYKLGANYIRFIKYMNIGQAKKNASLAITKEEKKLFFELIDSARRKYEKEDLEIRLHGNFGPKKGSKGEYLSKSNNYCPAGKNLFAISPDNTAYGCPFLMDYPLGKLIGSKINIGKDLCSGKRAICLTDYLSV